jgi:hypothetical protein
VVLVPVDQVVGSLSVPRGLVVRLPRAI